MAALVMLSAVLLGLFLPSSTADSVLNGGGTLYSGESLNQGAYSFVMQPDCNLVLYDSGRAVWSSGTYNQGYNCVLRMQTDGNLVIYSNNNDPIWASGTYGPGGNFILVLQSDRNVVIYSCPIWATGSNTANSKGVVIVKRGHNDTSIAAEAEAAALASDEPTNRKIAMVTNN
ncbi:mannose-specific lectin-like [Curcuma longa]|uniref:mannose-specific lectin-like n=1 Tax=Curcuma longa TaxID=136217 RepID=UPI003D9E0302